MKDVKTNSFVNMDYKIVGIQLSYVQFIITMMITTLMMIQSEKLCLLQHKPLVCVSLQVPAWLQQHKEMICSSESWMAEARTWLAAPCTYTTAKCLRNHVNALQVCPLASFYAVFCFKPFGENVFLCTADRPERRGPDPSHAAELHLCTDGDVAGLRHHSPAGAAGWGQPSGVGCAGQL